MKPTDGYGETGEINLSVSGGSGYAYIWNNGKQSKNIVGLSAGSYQVTVTDFATYCSTIKSFAVISNPIEKLCENYSLNSYLNDIATCENPNSTDILILPSDGFQNHKPYSTNPSLYNLKPGTYTYRYYITIDGKYCTNKINVTVPKLNCPIDNECKIDEFSLTTTPVSCPGGNDGSISLNYGTADISKYTISTNYGLGYSATGLSKGSYMAKIVKNDDEGCNITVRNVINEPEPFTLEGNYKLCPGDIAEITCKLDVNWSGPGIITSNLNRMTTSTAGFYTATLVNSNLCGPSVKTIEVIDRKDCPNNSNLCSPIEVNPEPFIPKTCPQKYDEIASSTAIKEYNEYIKTIREDFKKNYILKCLASKEGLEMISSTAEYHNTLYYYDLAGNLVKTIPPKGVKNLTDNEIAQLNAERLQNAPNTFPNHTYPSVYTFNSLNQLIGQNIPDHDPIKNQYTEVQPTSAGNSSFSVTGIDITDNGVGVVCGVDDKGYGVIYTSSPLGSEWTLSGATTRDDLHAVQAITNNVIIAAGSRGSLARSDDGGVTWYDIPTGIEAEFKYLYFSDVNNGFIIDKDAQCYTTTDGGKTLQPPYRLNIPASAELTDIEFVNPDLWYISFNYFGQGRVNYTIDKGITSQIEIVNNVYPSDVNDICMATPNTGYAVGDNGTIIKTTNNADNWSLLPSVSVDGNENNIEQVYFFDALNGFIRFANKKFMRTSDGGLTWSLFLDNASGNITSWDCKSAGKVCFISLGTLYETTDFCKTFTTRNLNGIPNISSVNSIDDLFVVGTTNGELYCKNTKFPTLIKLGNSNLSVSIDGSIERIITLDASNIVIKTSKGNVYKVNIYDFKNTDGTLSGYVDLATVTFNSTSVVSPYFTNIEKVSDSKLYATVIGYNAVFESIYGSQWVEKTTNVFTQNTIKIDPVSKKVFEISNSSKKVYQIVVETGQRSEIANNLTPDLIYAIGVADDGAGNYSVAACGKKGLVIIKDPVTNTYRNQEKITNNNLYEVIYSNDEYNCVGENKTHIVGSSNSKWRLIASNAKADINDISICGNKFLEVGSLYASPSPANATYDFNILENITVVSPNKAFAVGSSGAIVKFKFG